MSVAFQKNICEASAVMFWRKLLGGSRRSRASSANRRGSRTDDRLFALRKTRLVESRKLRGRAFDDHSEFDEIVDV